MLDLARRTNLWSCCARVRKARSVTAIARLATDLHRLWRNSDQCAENMTQVNRVVCKPNQYDGRVGSIVPWRGIWLTTPRQLGGNMQMLGSHCLGRAIKVSMRAAGFQRRVKLGKTVEHETVNRIFYLYNLRWAHSWSEIECDPKNDVELSCIPAGFAKRTNICSAIGAF